MSRQNANLVYFFSIIFFLGLFTHVKMTVDLFIGIIHLDERIFALSDFVNNRMAIKLWSEEKHMLIFDYDAYLQELVAVFGPGIEQKAWSYPPHFLLFLLPLQETDLVWSAIAYQIIGLVFFGVAVWLFFGQYEIR